MKRRMLISAPIMLGLLYTMVITVQTAKASVTYDLNNDGKVDIEDIRLVAAAFGSHLGDPRWNSVSDLNVNGIINIIDVSLVAKQFGQKIMITPASHHTAPIFVVPEYPIGPLLGLVGCFIALGIFNLIKSSKHNWHFSKR